MKMLTILLQASSAPASGSAAQGGAGTSSMMFWIMIIAMFVILWLFMIRPQRKQQKELENFRKSLKKGDKVVTVGGIYGVIDEINEKSALIKVDGDVKLRVDKNSLVKDYSDAQPK
ncbi:MAG: preprotein translocase subunit YajC [Bacteroidales bacterium]|nr:preprotein translocase subunit YajC [Bacteroidales bacterium]